MMAEFAKEVVRVNIEDEMRQSYLDYAMSVIVGRALPDVRDGLKPVHRRVLFAMHELKNEFNKPRMKSARIVGDVTGKYHPHGDQAVYDTLVRMAQNFSMRYMLVDGQGNFGSVDGDAPAAMRYTEVRLSKLAQELLRDLDRATVNFNPNYDQTMEEPAVMPTVVPNLLVNGSTGIAVGMATNIPPHNLGEVIDATIALIADPDISIDDLMRYIPGPDFPTAAIINGIAGVVEAYRTGRGRILIRAKAEIETEGGRETIIISELPYQVNKANLIKKIAELHKEKLIEGISPDGLRDESDKDGMRVVIEIKRGENAEVVLNNLYRQTQLESVYGINMVALVGGQPRTLNLKQILEAFVLHRREVVTRRTIFEIRKARSRAHILEGLTVALANIEEMIELIKTSPTPPEARERLLARRWSPGLVQGLLAEPQAAWQARLEEALPNDGLFDNGYQLSEIQAKEILEMRLARLTGLEQEKLSDEYRSLLSELRELFRIVEDPDRLLEMIRSELIQLRETYSDPRRTKIEQSQSDLDVLDLIPPEDVVVTLSHAGYIKRQPLTVYRSQRRGGRGRMAAALKEEDFVERLWAVNTHDSLFAFTSLGRVFRLKVHLVPEAAPGSRGRPIVNMLPLDPKEKVQAILPIKAQAEGSAEQFVFFATRMGVVKKTPLSDFANVRSNGIRATELDAGDGIVDVVLTDGTRDILLFGSHGKAARFAEQQVRAMGRTARGVRGIRLPEGATVKAVLMADPIWAAEAARDSGDPQNEADAVEPSELNDDSALPEVEAEAAVEVVAVNDAGLNDAGLNDASLNDAGIPQVLIVTERGFGKRTSLALFPRKSRGTQGVIAVKPSERNGELVGAVHLDDHHDVMLISDQGTLVRTRASEIATVGRNTQGVTLIRLADGERLVALVSIDAEPEEGVPSAADSAAGTAAQSAALSAGQGEGQGAGQSADENAPETNA